MIAIPQARTTRPARGPANRPISPDLNAKRLEVANHTMNVMVMMVANAKTIVMSANNHRLPAAAGYIKSGMSGSQGPKRKIVKRIHGVMDGPDFAGVASA